MRKANILISIAILVLLIVHAVLGSLQMMGGSTSPQRILSWVLLALVVAHMVIGTIYTVKTIRIQRQTGAYYFGQNKLFWARRISGFAIIIFLVFHFFTFGYTVEGAYRLHMFDEIKLASQIGLVASIAVHIVTNIRPMFISMGVRSWKKWLVDVMFVLSAIMLFAGIAFVIYYLRWNVF
ncbi:MAG: pilus assembly protein PilX [Firmicutes bacterium]|nr:pilus assembly protein PilX [Bacillota bacterium]MBQ9707618.1 pilus assembly protein PilX [Bacillota bacterium]